jgi:hypothetical protein
MAIEFILIDVATKAQCFSSANITEVNAQAAVLKAQGKKVQIKRMQVAADTEWHQREIAKFKTGTYKPLPKLWTEQKWFTSNPETEFHFAHIATDGERVAYTPDAKFGVEDKRLVLTPSRYLAKYFSKVLRSEQISDLANAFTADGFSLEIEATEEAFEFAYNQKGLRNVSSSAESCMGYDAKHFGIQIHPASVYAAGDLAIAFIRDPQNTEKVIARCVVWPEKRLANRCYGTNEKAREALSSKLRNLGYTMNANLTGARIKVVVPVFEDKYNTPSPAGQGYYYVVSPYIDGASIYLTWNEKDDGATFILDDGRKIYCGVGSNTCGYARVKARLRNGEVYCDECGAPTANARSILLRNSSRPRLACESCAPRIAFNCCVTQTWRSNDFAHDTILLGDNRQEIGWIDSEFVAECYRTGEFFDTRVFGPLVRVVNKHGEIEEICGLFRSPEDTDAQ